MCAYTTIYMCPHTPSICVLILPYTCPHIPMCPHTTIHLIYVASCYDKYVLIRVCILCLCPRVSAATTQLQRLALLAYNLLLYTVCTCGCVVLVLPCYDMPYMCPRESAATTQLYQHTPYYCICVVVLVLPCSCISDICVLVYLLHRHSCVPTCTLYLVYNI